MKTNFKLAGKWVLVTAVLFTVGCIEDDDTPAPATINTPSYTVPATYTFVNDSNVSTVSFSGQQQRLEMLSEMVTYMKTANTAGILLDATVLKNMYANDASYMWTDATGLGLTGSSKQLKSKTAAGDIGIQLLFEGYMDSIAAISNASVSNADQTYGIGGVWTNNSKNYLQSGSGIEYGQLIEKGLMAAVFMNQMTNNYLNLVPNDDNTNLASGKTYTDMQHHWDEAYGYFTSATDYPINGTDRFWGKYANRREVVLASATTIATAFRTGRAAIDNKDYTTRDAQITIIKNEMEKVCAGTAIHYLNEAKANITDPTLKNHVLSEAWAFLNGLKYGDNAISGMGMPASDIDMALGHIGSDFSAITIADINAAIDLIALRTGLESVKTSL